MRALLTFLIASLALSVVAAQQRGQPPPPTGTAFLAGQVVEVPSGRPMPAVVVSLSGPNAGRGGFQPVVTDSQGRFFFANLLAGSYTTQVIKAGYSPAAFVGFSRYVDLTAGERIVNLRLRMIELARVSGTVRDDAGDPVSGTDIRVIRRTIANGRPSLTMVGQARSDDRGAYRVLNLQPGEHFICACARDPIPFDNVLLTTLASEPMQLMGVAARALNVGADAASIYGTLRTFAPTFYPSSSTTARATRVTLAAGEDKSGLDVTVTATRATRVSGTVTGATSPVNAQSIRLVPAGENSEAAALVSLVPVLVQPNGRFDFAGVPPGQYEIRVSHTTTASRSGGPSGAALAFVGQRAAGMGPPMAPPSPDDPRLWATEPVTVGDDGVSGLQIALRPGTRVTGKAVFVGNAPQPAPQVLNRALAVLEPLNPDPNRGATGTGRLSAEGTFQIPGALPGRYSIGSTGIQGWPTLKSVTIAGVDVTDMAVDVSETDLTDVVLTFTDAPIATIAGALASASGVSEELSVLIFPFDRRYWTEPGAARRRFRAAPIGVKGTFNAAGLAAGEYLVAVVPDEAAADWQISSRLETLARGAQRVSLADGEKKTIEVRR